MNFAEMEPLFESLPGLMIIDKEGKTLYMSQQCADYFGVDRDSAVGEDVRKYFPES